MSREYPCIYFESGGKCTKFSDEESLAFCVMGPCEHETPSNADHIRAMTNEEHIRIASREELAEILSTGGCDGEMCGEMEAKFGEAACFDCRMIWLKQPYEGGKDDG
jgi:hypothetical protein